MFVKQCYDKLISIAQDSAKEKLHRRVNFLLDEFSSLPPIPDVTTMMTAARSRNIRFVLAVQSYNQLFAKYGDNAKNIMSNCTNWIFLFSREVALLDQVSTMCGSDADSRALFQPAQLQYLDKERNQVLILRGRNRPYLSYVMDIKDYLEFFDKSDGIFEIEKEMKTRSENCFEFDYLGLIEKIKNDNPDLIKKIRADGESFEQKIVSSLERRNRILIILVICVLGWIILRSFI